MAGMYAIDLLKVMLNKNLATDLALEARGRFVSSRKMLAHMQHVRTHITSR
jgi:hypothetical protein